MIYRDLAMRMVAAACKLVKVESRFDDEVISAFGEAFNNAVIHSYGPDGGDLHIEIETRMDRLTIRIMDFGQPFDPKMVPEPELDKLPESGLGLFIMRACMDDVTYTPGKPNVLSMTKLIIQGNERLET